MSTPWATGTDSAGMFPGSAVNGWVVCSLVVTAWTVDCQNSWRHNFAVACLACIKHPHLCFYILCKSGFLVPTCCWNSPSLHPYELPISGVILQPFTGIPGYTPGCSEAPCSPRFRWMFTSLVLSRSCGGNISQHLSTSLKRAWNETLDDPPNLTSWGNRWNWKISDKNGGFTIYAEVNWGILGGLHQKSW